MVWCIRRVMVVLAGAVGLPAVEAMGQCRYRVQLADSVPCPTFQGRVTCASDNGIFAGGGNCGLGVPKPFTWNLFTDNTIQVIPFPPGITALNITDINDSGTAVGYMSGPGINATHAFKFEKGMVSDLGVLPGGIHSAAYGINNVGVIVGSSGSSDGIRACIWQNGSINEIPTPKDLAAFAFAISGPGVIGGDFGWMETSHGFIYDQPMLLDIGTIPGGVSGHVHVINRQGKAGVNGLIQLSELQFRNQGFIWQSGVYSSIASIVGCGGELTESAIKDINNRGDFLGGASPCLPVVLQYGQVYDLYSLFDFQDGSIDFVTVLNDQGILAGSVYSESMNLFIPAVFIPVPPISGDFTCDNSVDIDDLTEVILQWGQPHPVIDVDKSGEIDTPDLLEVVRNWSMK